MTKLLLIRHGQSEANRQRIFAGHYNVDLSELGKKQAECTAEFVVNNYKVDKIYSSDLIRAYKTAKAIAAKLGAEIIIDNKLREIYAGQWEKCEFEKLYQYGEDYRIWHENIGRSRPTGGESVAELHERVYKAICKIALKNQGKTVVIATHATPIRALELRISGHGLDYMKNIPSVTNASVSEIVFENGRLFAVNMAQDKHLQHLNTTLPINV